MTHRALAAAGRFLAATALVGAAGCIHWQQEAQDERAADARLVEGYTQQAQENAIVVQHTLYPYHFVPDSATLTQLGEHDLEILAEHYRQQPGPLNVPRGGISEDLYRARVDAVRAELQEKGVDPARVTWLDDRPGGPGMSSERVLAVLDAEKAAAAKQSASAKARAEERKAPGYQAKSEVTASQ